MSEILLFVKKRHNCAFLPPRPLRNHHICRLAVHFRLLDVSEASQNPLPVPPKMGPSKKGLRYGSAQKRGRIWDDPDGSRFPKMSTLTVHFRLLDALEASQNPLPVPPKMEPSKNGRSYESAQKMDRLCDDPDRSRFTKMRIKTVHSHSLGAF